MVAYNFDARQVEPSTGGFRVYPAGRYPLVITKSDPKPTKNSTPENPASFIELELTIMDGPHKGGILYDRLNLQNSNPQAVDIAHRQLSAYCHVTGQFVIQDTAQLHGKPFLADVIEEPRNDDIAAAKAENRQPLTSNRILKVLDINGNLPGGKVAPATAPAGQAWPAQPAPVSGATPQPQWPQAAAPAPAGA